MVQTTILIISLTLAIILIIAGYFDYKHGGYLKLSGFVILLMLGLLTVISPIEIKSGELTNTTNQYTYENNETLLDSTSSTTEFVYTENNNILNNVFGIILVLAGLYGILRSRQDIIEDSDESLN